MGLSSAIRSLQIKLPLVKARNGSPVKKALERVQDVFIDIPHPSPSLKAGLLLRVWSDIDASPPQYTLENLTKYPETSIYKSDNVLEAALTNENPISQPAIPTNATIPPTNPKRPPFHRTSSATSTKSTTSTSSNPYHFWDSGFGVPIPTTESPLAPQFTDKPSFLAAVKAELHNVEFIQTGLTSYLRCINTGEHHTFSEEFLRKQNTATHITSGQLCQIKGHLEDVVGEVEWMGEDESEVAEHLTEAFGHAKPWIESTRAILVSSHVFYKINYVLAKGHEGGTN